MVQVCRLLGEEVLSKLVHQWYPYFREVTSLYLRSHKVTFGTIVSVVQLDESYLGHQPKYFKGAWCGQQYDIWDDRHSNQKTSC